jgi:alkylhydroperoxidase/carboxymuconolactone decarboxylase family protein YurZ
MVEAMRHVAGFAGVPRANHALKIIKESCAGIGWRHDDGC